tara:strand:+ start:1790 stop:2644 length:855 start_codon:yes stop_codon:yes gene_type:complete
MVTKVSRRALDIKTSGRSTDFITPSFGHGCLYDCSYCYMKRNKPEGLTIAKNIGDILTVVNNHAFFTPVNKPNQTHAEYTTYDISCNEDFALHLRHHDWENIFDFFKDHPVAMGSFATKYVNPKLIEYDPEGKIRIRFSLMPQHMSTLHEPHTSKIIDRIKAIDAFIDAGYDVHVNFSPVIVTETWLEDYKQLFQMLDDYVDYKEQVLAEVIFLTHNENKHKANLIDKPDAEAQLWAPDIQEDKISQYGGRNIRYERHRKREYINQFINLHGQIIPWNKIRYIF